MCSIQFPIALPCTAFDVLPLPSFFQLCCSHFFFASGPTSISLQSSKYFQNTWGWRKGQLIPVECLMLQISIRQCKNMLILLLRLELKDAAPVVRINPFTHVNTFEILQRQKSNSGKLDVSGKFKALRWLERTVRGIICWKNTWIHKISFK